MTRDNHGRFPKGFSGNRKGRPRKPKRTFTNEQVREDILFAMEEKLPISVNGKIKKIPAIQLIAKQLVMKAVKGDNRCILKALEIRQKTIAEMVNERLSLLQTYLENVKLYKQQPEDVTDEMLEHLRVVREMLENDGLLH